MTLQEIETKLDEAGITTARIDALGLLEFVTGFNKTVILAGDLELTDKQTAQLNKLLVRRIQNREPLAYLVNNKEFYGRDFYVDKHVLVPRPESEDMITLALDLKLQPGSQVLDLGCGSGCLAITYQKEIYKLHPKSEPTESRLWLVMADLSPGALAIAKRNTRKHRVRAQGVESDLLSHAYLQRGFDLVLANLPYVPYEPSYTQNSPELKAEPSQALYSGSDGLKHYTRLFEQLSALEQKPQHIITESLTKQHQALASLAKDTGYELQSSIGLAQHFERIN